MRRRGLRLCVEQVGNADVEQVVRPDAIAAVVGRVRPCRGDHLEPRTIGRAREVAETGTLGTRRPRLDAAAHAAAYRTSEDAREQHGGQKAAVLPVGERAHE